MPKYVLSGASGLLLRGNIDIDARTYVAVPVGNGQYASVRSTSWHQSPEQLIARYGTDFGRSINGAEVLVPEIIRVGHKWVAVKGKASLNHFYSTGRHLGIFTDASHANRYGSRLHEQQAQAFRRGIHG